jgi:hypothetical protein
MFSLLLSAAVSLATQHPDLARQIASMLHPLPPRVGIPKPVGPKTEPIPIESAKPAEPCEPKKPR